MSTPQAEPTVAPLKLPPITEETLANGLAVVTARKADLPLVAVRLVIRAGAARDPKGKEGLASFAGALLRRGTTKRTADEIDDAVEQIGGLLGVDVGYESTSIAATVPSEHVATALDVIAELARRPSFPEKEFNLEKRRHLAQLQQELDDPSGVADRALIRFFYGKDHPYAHPTDGHTASVKTFKRADMAAFHEKAFTPRGATLFFVGDIDAKTAGELARQVLGSWTGADLPERTKTAPGQASGIDVLVVDKPDATQAQVRAVVPGMPRKDPAYYAAIVANTIVGGGFTSRLVDEVRVNRGLSYSVSTRVIALRDTGAVSFSTFTRTDTVRQIIDVSLKVMSEFHKNGPTEEEVRKAKRYVIGLYPGRVESIDALAEALAGARLADLPFDSIEAYRNRIGDVDVAAAAGAARFFPNDACAKIVVVGSAEKIRPQLAGLGTLSVARIADYE